MARIVNVYIYSMYQKSFDNKRVKRRWWRRRVYLGVKISPGLRLCLCLCFKQYIFRNGAATMKAVREVKLAGERQTDSGDN